MPLALYIFDFGLDAKVPLRFHLHCAVLSDGEVGGAAGAKPSSSAKKLSSAPEELTKCPSPRRVISRIGRGDVLAFCSAAANLCDCDGATRGSFSAVMSSTPG